MSEQFTNNERIDVLFKNLFNRVGVSSSLSVVSESRVTAPVYDASYIWTDADALKKVDFGSSFTPEFGRYYTIDENDDYKIKRLDVPPDLSFPTENILLYRRFVISRVNLATTYYRDLYDDSNATESSYNIYPNHTYPSISLKNLVNPFIFPKFSNYTKFTYNLNTQQEYDLGSSNNYVLKDGFLIIFTGLNIPSGANTQRVRVEGFQYLARFGGGGSGSSVSRVITVNNDFSVSPSYGTVLVSNSNSSVTITLPSANSTRGRTIRVMKVSNSVYPVYVQVNESNLRILNSIDNISGIDTITTSRRYILRQQFECAEFFNVSLNPPAQDIAWIVTSIL